MENMFFEVSSLKNVGKRVIIGKTARIRYPELVELGDDVIVDDFCYISTALTVESRVHIASGCKLIGGRKSAVVMRSFSTLAPGVVLAAGSDDYDAGIAGPFVPLDYKGSAEIGTIEVGRHCIVGANSVVLPNVSLGDGAALGALSLANRSLEEWSLYAGVPAKRLRARNRASIEALEAAFLASITQRR